MKTSPQIKTRDYQEKLINWLSALDDRTPEQSDLADLIDPATLHRLTAYQSSYLGRVTASLADTLFEACMNLYGEELVTQILASYFKHHPPHSQSLTDAPITLPAELRKHNHSRESLLFADLAEICIQRWKILTSEDPSIALPDSHSRLAEIKLISTCSYIQPCAHHNLSAAWNAAQQKQSDLQNELFFSECVGVILAKTSPTDFLVLEVPSELSSLAQELVGGRSAEHALNALSETKKAKVDENDLALRVTEFFSKATSSKLFTKIQLK